MTEREELYAILCRDIKATGNWDKVVELNGNYYENFCIIRNYVKRIIENGKD